MNASPNSTVSDPWVRPDPSPISIIVPTFREAANIPHLAARVAGMFRTSGLSGELLILDDDSRDGTDEVVDALGLPWVRLIVRTRNRGLSPAVIDGLRAARFDRLVVMDADLSHPPEKIPEMLAELDAGADFVIGSRYVAGGTTDAEWGLFRQLNSRVATLLARPFTTAADPMAGFFALRADTFRRGEAGLNPIGYKIGLELLVKCGCRDVREVPIHFADRIFGDSKLSMAEQLKYVRHLGRLAEFRYPAAVQLAKFSAVGAVGTVVNLAVLTALTLAGVSVEFAVAAAVLVSLAGNFELNRRFTFPEARGGSVLGQFAAFAATCSLGAAVNYVTNVALLWLSPGLYPQAAALVGIAAGMIFNFVGCRTVAFRPATVEPAVGPTAPAEAKPAAVTER